MNAHNAYIFIPFIGLAINIFFQVLIFRIFSKVGLLRSLFLGFICGCLVVSGTGFGSKLIINMFIYMLLGYCYFHFVNMVKTARRIRILTELKNAPGGLSLAQILEHYNSKDVIERRLSRLIDHGQITVRNERYYIGNSSMLIIAKILEVARIIVFGARL